MKNSVEVKFKAVPENEAKQGKHLLIYRDELDKWLELSRKNPVPLTAEEENEKISASFRRKAKPLNW